MAKRFKVKVLQRCVVGPEGTVADVDEETFNAWGKSYLQKIGGKVADEGAGEAAGPEGRSDKAMTSDDMKKR